MSKSTKKSLMFSITGLIFCWFLTVFLLSVSVRMLGESLYTAAVTFLFLSMTLLFLSWGGLQEVMEKRLVARVVGILPGELTDWKWREVARVKAEATLRDIALRLKALDEGERLLLKSPNSSPGELVNADKAFRETLREFRTIIKAFSSGKYELKDPGLSESWKDYI